MNPKAAKSNCCDRRLRYMPLVGMVIYGAANAHLNDANVPPCFEMQNERVAPLPNTSGENVIVFSAPDVTPINQSKFASGELLNVSVHITGRICSPFNVFFYALLAPKQSKTLIQQSSPSLLYAPGNVNYRVAHYVTFAIDPKNVQAGAEMAISAVRLIVTQYGSGK